MNERHTVGKLKRHFLDQPTPVQVLRFRAQPFGRQLGQWGGHSGDISPPDDFGARAGLCGGGAEVGVDAEGTATKPLRGATQERAGTSPIERSGAAWTLGQRGSGRRPCGVGARQAHGDNSAAQLWLDMKGKERAASLGLSCIHAPIGEAVGAEAQGSSPDWIRGIDFFTSSGL